MPSPLAAIDPSHYWDEDWAIAKRRQTWTTSYDRTETAASRLARARALFAKFKAEDEFWRRRFGRPQMTQSHDDHLDEIDTLLTHHRGNLTEWEETFCEDIQRQLRAGRALSQKQRDVLDRISTKCATKIAKREAWDA